jgi:hypothetical protein
MNDQPLEQNINTLLDEITDFRSHAAKWYGKNTWKAALLIWASTLATLGATISAVTEHNWTAAIFSAFAAATVTLQNAFKYSQKARYYGRAITECDRLTRKVKLQLRSALDFDGILGAFDELRNDEGAEGDPNVKK